MIKVQISVSHFGQEYRYLGANLIWWRLKEFKKKKVRTHEKKSLLLHLYKNLHFKNSDTQGIVLSCVKLKHRVDTNVLKGALIKDKNQKE